MSSWSTEEVEATAADYFNMLDKEIREFHYNKTAHRRGLLNLLNGRTDGAVERKHQNISAILIELGFVYISGYKPLSNYQQRLYEVVSDRLARSRELTKIARQDVTAPAEMPTVEDILATWTAAPTSNRPPRKFAERSPRTRRGVDYLARGLPSVVAHFQRTTQQLAASWLAGHPAAACSLAGALEKRWTLQVSLRA